MITLKYSKYDFVVTNRIFMWAFKGQGFTVRSETWICTLKNVYVMLQKMHQKLRIFIVQYLGPQNMKLSACSQLFQR